jgi:hypothetical protein
MLFEKPCPLTLEGSAWHRENGLTRDAVLWAFYATFRGMSIASNVRVTFQLLVQKL